MKHHSIKILIFVSLLAAFIIGLSIFSQQLLRKDSENLKASIDATGKYIDSGDWNGANSSIGETGKMWSGVKPYWSALIDHQEIDNIDVTLSQLEMAIKSKELPDSFSEAAALKTYIGHIPQKEQLKLENLF